MSRLVAVALAWVALFASPSAAGVVVQIVLDGSGSMWGQLGGQSKVVVARDGLSAALSTHARVPAGLTVFGSGAAQGCADRVTAVEPAAGNAEAIRDYVAAMNPRGTAPLISALENARDRLRGLPELEGPGSQALVVAVVDGGDACLPDPCSRFVASWAQGDPQLHVIGLAVRDPEALEQLNCIAAAGRGRFHEVRTTKQLKERLEEILGDALAEERRAIAAAERARAEASRVRAATRLEVHFATRIDPVFCEHIEIARTTVDGRAISGLPERLPCAGDVIVHQEVAEVGEHELEFAYWKVGALGRVRSERARVSFRIEPGVTTRIDLGTDPRLGSYGVSVSIDSGAHGE